MAGITCSSATFPVDKREPSPFSSVTSAIPIPPAPSSLRSLPRASSPPCSEYSMPSSPNSSLRSPSRGRFHFSPSCRVRSRSRSIFTTCSASSQRTLASVLLQRKPSSADIALSEERSRCAGDHIERLGLSLMEPRPVDPLPVIRPSGFDRSPLNLDSIVDLMDDFSYRPTRQPRCVMDNIFEIMEGPVVS